MTDDFDHAMRNIYNRALSELGYRASRFHQMLRDHGGIETAHRLLPSMSEGFEELWRRNRLDLTVEALVIQPRWKPLFTAKLPNIMPNGIAPRSTGSVSRTPAKNSLRRVTVSPINYVTF